MSDAGRRWAIVASALLVLVGVAAIGILLACTTSRLTFLTRNRLTGCLKRCETGRSQRGRGMLSFQTI